MIPEFFICLNQNGAKFNFPANIVMSFALAIIFAYITK